jgi:hypothetical protein
MTPEQFAYWLQGFTELSPDMPVPSPAQWQAIKDHLQTVFVKVTPAFGGPLNPRPGTISTQGPAFADPARQFTTLEQFERGMLGRSAIC